MVIQIQISDEQWEKLNSMKERGESFSEVLDKILNIKKEVSQRNTGSPSFSKCKQ